MMVAGRGRDDGTSDPATEVLPDQGCMHMSISVKSFDAADLLSVLPTATDEARQALRHKFLRELWVAAKRVGGGSVGSEAIDREIVLTWGPFDATKPFATPFDGAAIPSEYQVKPIPSVNAVAKEKAAGRPASTALTKWGREQVDAFTNLGPVNECVIPRELACTNNVVIPAGTNASTLSEKDLARGIWREWQDLGLMGNKIRVIRSLWHAAYLRSQVTKPLNPIDNPSS
jgi:hypothetical protein